MRAGSAWCGRADECSSRDIIQEKVAVREPSRSKVQHLAPCALAPCQDIKPALKSRGNDEAFPPLLQKVVDNLLQKIHSGAENEGRSKANPLGLGPTEVSHRRQLLQQTGLATVATAPGSHPHHLREAHGLNDLAQAVRTRSQAFPEQRHTAAPSAGCKAAELSALLALRAVSALPAPPAPG